MKKIFAFVIAALVLVSCSSTPEDVTKLDTPAPIYPDYTDITIPVNIAPLNFLIRDDVSRVCVYINNVEFYNGSGKVVEYDAADWQSVLAENAGKTVNVRIDALYQEGWKEYRQFKWKIVADKVDPYLTYRLIEPDYEVFNDLVLQERCVEDFSTRNLCDHGLVGNKCMNCHTYAAQDPTTTMFYVRGEGGGAILNLNGELQKLNIKGENMISGSVYFGFSPTRRYITFSTNKIVPAFHSKGSKRLEVFDSASDVYVADIVDHKFESSPLLDDSTCLETFPTFSPDGKYIYFCTAHTPDSIGQLRQLKYSLCRIPFDENTGKIGSEVDTIYSASKQGRSVCHPRISPDGRFLVFTVADYGTFPIWHQESDLQMMDLKTGKLISMAKANSQKSDTYHSWSSNSRWLVFASKRDDGLYGKPYFTYIDSNGNCSKPFVLPQEDPAMYDNTLKSFNAPELGKGLLPFTAKDVEKALDKDAINFQ